MYCQTCGVEVAPGLSYCNRCGAKLNAAPGEMMLPTSKLAGATWAISAAMTLVTLGGFLMVLSCVLTIITRNLHLSDEIVFLLFCFLLIILGVDLMLARQLSRIISLNQQPGETSEVKNSKLKGRQVAQIEAAREPVMSVTENTTRFFEPVGERLDTQTRG